MSILLLLVQQNDGLEILVRHLISSLHDDPVRMSRGATDTLPFSDPQEENKSLCSAMRKELIPTRSLR